MTRVTDHAPRYAGPVDYAAYGQYGPGRGFSAGRSFQRPRYRFQGRITADGSSGYAAEPGRYHLYIAWGCPWAQRTAIVRKLKGLEEIVSLSYVDDERDGRGWAFRERRGPDPVNGFTYLAEAYEATEPGYDGHVSVPVLWDRQTRQIVSNNFPDITIDLGTQFERWAGTSGSDREGFPRTSPDLYPAPLRPDIDALNERVYDNVNNGTYKVAGATTEADYQRLRQQLIAMLGELDQRLAASRYLFGAGITEADVRLWPQAQLRQRRPMADPRRLRSRRLGHTAPPGDPRPLVSRPGPGAAGAHRAGLRGGRRRCLDRGVFCSR